MRNVGLNSWGTGALALFALSLEVDTFGGAAGRLTVPALVVAALLLLFVGLATALGWPGGNGSAAARRGEGGLPPHRDRGRSRAAPDGEDGRGAARRDP